MNDNRNMILAIVLSLIVLVGWSYLAERWFPVSQPQTQRVENGKVEPAPPPPASPAAPAALRSRAVVIASTPRVRFQNQSISGSINLKGARIDDLVMLKQRATVDPRSPPVPLLSPQGARAASFVGFGWNGDGVSVLELRGRARLAREAGEEGVVRAQLAVQDLEGDGALELEVARGVDLAHASAAEEPFDLVLPVDDGADERTLG